ncbi:type I-E CRISPR-associated protein Cse2/CasB [Desulfovibrio psychrotolerans]|uniref:Type I-E CRISPR-associated protein Cse2/CasB n=1 Tax=Desulfovibrio psychrotolerans TaxID=415242 RepID=A0A7J0BW12_9BACT|nr:type I-E CRISPR-associated protein Cse2/CasB [Desulfovibrio psychrotolerans]GFM37362.1 hypothetical protein DSM19430T_20460 [Desulfovibrio psychrotolerans]
MSAFGAFLKNDTFKGFLHTWWEGLKQNRGMRAELRRARSPLDVLVSRAYQRNFLPGLLRESGIRLVEDEMESLALPVGILAHVCKLDKRTIPEALAAMQAEKPGTGGRSMVDLRMQRLLAITDRDELYTACIRLVRFMDDTVNLTSLTESGFWWTEDTRKRWALAYYVAPEQRPAKGDKK